MSSTAIVFDTLRYAKKLVKVGFTQQQAEVQAEALAEVVDDKLATKQDLEQTKSELKRDIKELDLKIEAIKNELLLKLGGMMVSGIGLIVLLMKLFKL